MTRPRAWRKRRRVAVAGALACALVVVPAPAGISTLPVTVERPAPVLRWHLMGLPDPALVARLVMVESSGNPTAVSDKGAIGLMQVMPSLAKALGADPARLHEPEYNLMLGARWLGTLIRRYGVDGALRAYNAGETARHLWHTAPVNEYVRKIKEG